jgi:hypothetical protein
MIANDTIIVACQLVKPGMNRGHAIETVQVFLGAFNDFLQSSKQLYWLRKMRE